jgi:transcriptional regulator of acetoin/glycerol metabolism
MRAAASEMRALILGESGTGKEVVAQCIHDESRRRTGPFVAVDCGAIPHELFESAMFGHLKGAYTGATGDHMGYWEEADGGTLFLDEIGELTPAAQVKILRALETGKIRRLGGAPITPNVRVIAATSRDLSRMMAEGTFAVALFQRLRGHTIRTPTLRSRPEDIPLLAARRWAMHPNATPLSADVLDALSARPWPGNVRELFQRLDELHDLFGDGVLGLDHLDAVLAEDDESPIDRRVGREVRGFEDVRMRCFWHISGAIDVLRAAQLPLRDPMCGKPLEPGAIARLAVLERRRLEELELLCTHVFWFRVTPAYTMVRDCKRLLRRFAESLIADPEAALAFWRETVSIEIDRTIAFLFLVLRDLETGN